MHLILLAMRSAWSRRYALSLAVASIALSVSLLLGIEYIRHAARQGFTQSVSGVDLIIGPRGSSLQSVLFTVFHLGEPEQEMGWQTAQHFAQHPAVAWSIPLILDDSHRGFPVLATNADYFRYFRYADHQALRMETGRPFSDVSDVFEAVVGADVARRLHYAPGQRIVLSHGAGEMTHESHADKPFTVVGVLAPTGTPVDRTVHISLAGMEAIHLDWQGGVPVPGWQLHAEDVRKFDLTPKTITAQLIGLKRRGDALAMQREVAAYPAEAVMGVMPGVALDELWRTVGQVEQVLMLVSWLVALVGLAGMVAAILAGLEGRRRELAILRSVGARPLSLLALLLLEGLFTALCGILAGIALLAVLGYWGGAWLTTHYGIVLSVTALSDPATWQGMARLLGWMLLAACAASLLPGWRAYRTSLADGLMPR